MNRKTHCAPEGRQEVYNQKVQCAKGKALAVIVPFNRFPVLPLEIPLMVWGLALPEARVLTRRFEEGLVFYKKDNPPNPRMLSACRESRNVALNTNRPWLNST